MVSTASKRSSNPPASITLFGAHPQVDEMPPSTDAQGNPTAAQRNPPGFDCASSWGLRPDSQLEIVDQSLHSKVHPLPQRSFYLSRGSIRGSHYSSTWGFTDRAVAHRIRPLVVTFGSSAISADARWSWAGTTIMFGIRFTMEAMRRMFWRVPSGSRSAHSLESSGRSSRFVKPSRCQTRSPTSA
jgi:hypothetical protein